MTDDRLNDLCLLDVERDIDVNFKQLIDKLSDIYKNRRVIFKQKIIFCLHLFCSHV